jgi:hypothetical protein
MSAPAHEKPDTEQPTQPLPIPHQYSRGLRSPLWIPGTVAAAIVTGELIRDYVLVTDTSRSDFAIVVLLLVLALTTGLMFCDRFLDQRDGRGRD